MREPDRERFLLGGDVPFIVVGGDVLLFEEESGRPVLESMATPDAAITAFAFSLPSRITSLPSDIASAMAGASGCCTAPSLVPFSEVDAPCAGDETVWAESERADEEPGEVMFGIEGSYRLAREEDLTR